MQSALLLALKQHRGGGLWIAGAISDGDARIALWGAAVLVAVAVADTVSEDERVPTRSV